MKKPRWMRVIYKKGELWIDGIHLNPKVGVQELFAKPFGWEGDVRGYIRREGKAYQFYTDREMKRIGR